MKRVLTLLVLLGIALSLQARQVRVPTPEMATGFWIDRDPRKWSLQFFDGDETMVRAAFFLPGDSPQHWNEMAENQVTFRDVSVREYVDGWKKYLQKSDPKVEFKEETMKDGSIFLIYTSLADDKICEEKFMKGSDGIYKLYYLVRPKFKNKETFAIWEGII